VRIRAGTDDNGFNLCVVQNGPVVSQGRWDLKIGGTLLGRFDNDVGNGDHIGFRDTVGQVLGVHPADAACANNAYVDMFGHQ